MKISVTRSGGYAGLSEELARIDTATLDTRAAGRIEGRVEEAKFFALPAFISGGAVGADFYKYEVAVEDQDRAHRVTFVDDESPETAPLRRIVEAVASL